MGAANTFMQVQGFSMTVCAIIAGWVMRRIRRFKVRRLLGLSLDESLLTIVADIACTYGGTLDSSRVNFRSQAPFLVWRR